MAIVSFESEEAVRREAAGYAVSNYGNLVGVGLAVFDARNNVWVIPILVRVGDEVVVAGELELSETGEVVRAPTRDELRAQIARRPKSRDNG